MMLSLWRETMVFYFDEAFNLNQSDAEDAKVDARYDVRSVAGDELK